MHATESFMKANRLNTIKKDATITTDAIVAMLSAVSAGKSMKAAIADFAGDDVQRRASRLERMAKTDDLPASLARIALQQVYNLLRMVDDCARDKRLFVASGQDTQLVCVELLNELGKLAAEARQVAREDQKASPTPTGTRITTTKGYTLEKAEGDDTGRLFWTVELHGNPIEKASQSLLRLGADGDFTDGNEATGLVLSWAGTVEPRNQNA